MEQFYFVRFLSIVQNIFYENSRKSFLGPAWHTNLQNTLTGKKEKKLPKFKIKTFAYLSACFVILCHYSRRPVPPSAFRNISSSCPTFFPFALISLQNLQTLSLFMQMLFPLGARICKPFSEPTGNDSQPGGPVRQPLFVVPARHAGYMGLRNRFLGINSWAP